MYNKADTGSPFSPWARLVASFSSGSLPEILARVSPSPTYLYGVTLQMFGNWSPKVTPSNPKVLQPDDNEALI